MTARWHAARSIRHRARRTLLANSMRSRRNRRRRGDRTRCNVRRAGWTVSRVIERFVEARTGTLMTSDDRSCLSPRAAPPRHARALRACRRSPRCRLPGIRVSPEGSRPRMPWRRMPVKATSAPAWRTSSTALPMHQEPGGTTTERTCSSNGGVVRRAVAARDHVAQHLVAIGAQLLRPSA